MRAKRFKPYKWGKSAKLLGAVTLSLAVIAGCSSGSEPAATQQTAQDQSVKSVKIAKINKQSIGDPLEQVADVKPVVQLDIMSKIGGDVMEVLKRRGELVQAGDVILKLDPTDMNLSKEKAMQSLRNSEVSLANSRRDLENSKTEMANSVLKAERGLAELVRNFNELKNKYDLGLITEAQLDQAEIQLKNTQLDMDILKQKQKTLETSNSLAGLEYSVTNAQLTLQELERSMEHLQVKAPVSGILTDMPIVGGMTIGAGTRIGQVQQLNPIKIIANLTEEGAKLVRGKKELHYYVPGSDIKGMAPVVFLSEVMDTQSKSFELELEVANTDNKLKPGMKAQVQLTNEAEQVVVTVPTTSIVREANDSYVFILNGDTVEKRLIKLGRLNALNQEVLSGVKEGESLVVSGQNTLKDKEKVQVTGGDNK